MVRGWRLLLLVGTTLARGAGRGEAALPPSHEEPGPAARLERPSQSTTVTADELLELSGLRAQLVALEVGIRAQLLTARPGLSPEDRAVIERIVARHFDAGVLYTRIRLAFTRDLMASDLNRALAWFRSPLGRRITRSEVDAINAPREAPPWPSERRIELVQRLDERGGASETMLEVAVNLVRSLDRAAAPFRPAHLHLTAEQLESRLARTRTEVLAPIRMTCIQNMLFAYRGLDDAELARYLVFVESLAGQWYVTRMNAALIDAVGASADLAAVELVTLVPHLTGDGR